MGGHGYSIVRVASDELETEFVCIPSSARTQRTAGRWPAGLSRKNIAPACGQKGETAKTKDQSLIEGNPKFSL